MCIPFTNYDDIPEVYRYIVSLLEQPSYGQINVQHSQSYEMLNDPSIRQYLMEWATNGTYNYFSPRLGTLGHPNQYPYFAGRWFNDILEDGEFIGGSRSTRKARRNASAEHDILTDEVFVQNFKKNFLKLKRRTNRKTPKRNSGNKHTTNKKKNKIPANQTPNYTEGEEGHTSTNIIPMSEDTFQTLVSLFQDPLYKPMLLMLFQGGDTTEE
jgi:hypothetical protein